MKKSLTFLSKANNKVFKVMNSPGIRIINEMFLQDTWFVPINVSTFLKSRNKHVHQTIIFLCILIAGQPDR